MHNMAGRHRYTHTQKHTLNTQTHGEKEGRRKRERDREGREGEKAMTNRPLIKTSKIAPGF